MPRLDHAIHAGLLLAYVALRTGDRVGLFAFDESVKAYLDPVGGIDSFPRIQRAAVRTVCRVSNERSHVLRAWCFLDLARMPRSPHE